MLIADQNKGGCRGNSSLSSTRLGLGRLRTGIRTARKKGRGRIRVLNISAEGRCSFRAVQQSAVLSVHRGEESSQCRYTGAAPNQQAIPAVRYLMSKEGGVIMLGFAWNRLCLSGTTNRSGRLSTTKAWRRDITTIYTPFGHSDWREIVARIKAFGSEGKRTAVINHQRRREHISTGTEGATGERRHPSRDGALGWRTRNARHWRDGWLASSRHGIISNPSAHRKTIRS